MSLRSIIAPSLLSCDFAKLGEESKRIIELGADWLHCDVMDGHFVNNLTIGPLIIKAIRSYVGQDAFLDCHLMITEPWKWISEFHKAGASQVTLHIETLEPSKAVDIFREIKKTGMNAGVALKPSTPLETVLPLLEEKYNDKPLIDMVLLMTVEPGFGGQAFMKEVLPKIKSLRDLYSSLDIQVDGGVSTSTIDLASEAGANVIVAGSAVFGSANPGEVIKKLRESVDRELSKK